MLCLSILSCKSLISAFSRFENLFWFIDLSIFIRNKLTLCETSWSISFNSYSEVRLERWIWPVSYYEIFSLNLSLWVIPIIWAFLVIFWKDLLVSGYSKQFAIKSLLVFNIYLVLSLLNIEFSILRSSSLLIFGVDFVKI